MNQSFQQHIPVLLHEAVEMLLTDTNGIYVDATFGRGSHSRAILDRLSENGRLIAFDKDPEAVAYGKQYFTSDKRFTILHQSYAQLKNNLLALDVFGNIQGILFDLGVSSPQLDNPERGFSFSKTGQLDMRMDTTQGMSALEWIATVEEAELAQVLWQYGEEKFSRRIAKAIVLARKDSPITTTQALADIIKYAVPKLKKSYDKHPATRSFQAIRIRINQELAELETGLAESVDALQVGGRIAVISFHSLEDRMVKQFIRSHEKGSEVHPRRLPVKSECFNPRFQSIGKAIKPNLNEINHNPRARSAILRIAEKKS
jgi:16S rRNA (cytosine1402-N4)-methyltransferase